MIQNGIINVPSFRRVQQIHHDLEWYNKWAQIHIGLDWNNKHKMVQTGIGEKHHDLKWYSKCTMIQNGTKNLESKVMLVIFYIFFKQLESNH